MAAVFHAHRLSGVLAHERQRFGQYAGQTLTVGKVTSRPNGVAIVDSKLNQATGQPIKIKARKTLRFKASVGLRDI